MSCVRLALPVAIALREVGTARSVQPTLAGQSLRRPRKTIYTAEDAKALAFLSDLFDGINAKLLRAAPDVELY